MCINVMHIVYNVAEVKYQRGGRALFKRPVAEGKKLFRWREVLVPMERSLLPEGRMLPTYSNVMLLTVY